MSYETTNRFKITDYFTFIMAIFSILPSLYATGWVTIFMILLVMIVIGAILVLYTQLSGVPTLTIDYDHVTFGLFQKQKLELRKISKVEKASKKGKGYVLYYDHKQRQKKKHILDVYAVEPEVIANEITKRLYPKQDIFFDM